MRINSDGDIKITNYYVVHTIDIFDSITFRKASAPCHDVTSGPEFFLKKYFLTAILLPLKTPSIKTKIIKFY